jgi:hypothetical protein
MLHSAGYGARPVFARHPLHAASHKDKNTFALPPIKGKAVRTKGLNFRGSSALAGLLLL